MINIRSTKSLVSLHIANVYGNIIIIMIDYASGAVDLSRSPGGLKKLLPVAF